MGTTKRTKAATPPMMSRLLESMGVVVRRVGMASRASGARHRAAIARRVDVFDAHALAGAHADAQRAVRRLEGAEHLDDLTVDLEGHDPLPVGVERRHGGR